MIPGSSSIRKLLFHSLQGTFDLFAGFACLTNVCCFKLFLNENLFYKHRIIWFFPLCEFFLSWKLFITVLRANSFSSYKYFLWWNLNPHFLLNALSQIIRSWAPPLCIIWGLSRFLLLLHLPHLSFRLFCCNKIKCFLIMHFL